MKEIIGENTYLLSKNNAEIQNTIKIDIPNDGSTTIEKLKEIIEYIEKNSDNTELLTLLPTVKEIKKRYEKISAIKNPSLNQKNNNERIKNSRTIENYEKEIRGIATSAGIARNNYGDFIWQGIKSNLLEVSWPASVTNTTAELISKYLSLTPSDSTSKTVLFLSLQVSPAVFFLCLGINSITTIALKEKKTWKEAFEDYFKSREYVDSFSLAAKFFFPSIGLIWGHEYFKTLNYFKELSDSPLSQKCFVALGAAIGSGAALFLTAEALLVLSEIIKRCFFNEYYSQNEKFRICKFVKELVENIGLFPNAFVEGFVCSLLGDLEIAKAAIAYFQIKDKETFRIFLAYAGASGITGILSAIAFAFPGDLVHRNIEYVGENFCCFFKTSHENKRDAKKNELVEILYPESSKTLCCRRGLHTSKPEPQNKTEVLRPGPQ